MTPTQHEAGLSGMMALLLSCCACTSLDDLSSYSGGSDAPPPAFQATSPESSAAASNEPPAPTPDAGASEPEAVEAQDPANVALVPSDSIDATNSNSNTNTNTDSSDPSEPSDDCTGEGTFTDADASVCYIIGDTAASWGEGRDFCESWGGDLVQVGSREENALLREHATLDVWLGANDLATEGDFRWLDGGALDDGPPWAFGQPDDFENIEDCVELRAMDDSWNDVPCSSLKPPVCERALQPAVSE